MLYRVPLAEVMLWPASHVDAIEHYLARVPAAEDQQVSLLAQLCSMFANVNREPNSQATEPAQFMPWLNAFEQPKASRYSDTDKSFMAAFGLKVR